MNGEERLLEVFRALDNRERRTVLAIAEAELKYAPVAAYTARGGVLDVSSGNCALGGEKRECEEITVR